VVAAAIVRAEVQQRIILLDRRMTRHLDAHLRIALRENAPAHHARVLRVRLQRLRTANMTMPRIAIIQKTAMRAEPRRNDE
jgi:hypothetical protein